MIPVFFSKAVISDWVVCWCWPLYTVIDGVEAPAALLPRVNEPTTQDKATTAATLRRVDRSRTEYRCWAPRPAVRRHGAAFGQMALTAFSAADTSVAAGVPLAPSVELKDL